MDIENLYKHLHSTVADIVGKRGHHSPMLFVYRVDDMLPNGVILLPEDGNLRSMIVDRVVNGVPPKGFTVVVIHEAQARILGSGWVGMSDVIAFSIFNGGKHLSAACRISRPGNKLERAPLIDCTVI